MNTSVVFWPVNGNLNVLTTSVGPTSNLNAPFLLLRFTFCPVLNGWLGIWIVRVGIDKLLLVSPITWSTSIAPPAVVPTPTDWGPLKNIKSFLSETNFLVLTGINIWLFNTSISEPKVWAIPACLCILITFGVGNISNTFNISVSVVFPEPTLNDPPTATELGIEVTKISWITPLALPTFIVCASPILSVLIPTLNVFVKLTIELLNPDTDIASWSFNSTNGR